MLVIFGGDKIKRPLHLCDTQGLRIVHRFKNGLFDLEQG